MLNPNVNVGCLCVGVAAVALAAAAGSAQGGVMLWKKALNGQFDANASWIGAGGAAGAAPGKNDEAEWDKAGTYTVTFPAGGLTRTVQRASVFQGEVTWDVNGGVFRSTTEFLSSLRVVGLLDNNIPTLTVTGGKVRAHSVRVGTQSLNGGQLLINGATAQLTVDTTLRVHTGNGDSRLVVSRKALLVSNGKTHVWGKNNNPASVRVVHEGSVWRANDDINVGRVTPEGEEERKGLIAALDKGKINAGDKTIFVGPGGDVQGGNNVKGRRVDITAKDLKNMGAVNPGGMQGGGQLGGFEGVGKLNLYADYQQFQNGALGIEIAGTQATLQHDLLHVHGHAHLNGLLSVLFIDGWQPAIGDRYTVLRSQSLSGGFDGLSVNVSPPLGGAYDVKRHFSLPGGGSSVVLRVVPSPGAATLVLAGACTVAVRRRRRAR